MHFCGIVSELNIKNSTIQHCCINSIKFYLEALLTDRRTLASLYVIRYHKLKTQKCKKELCILYFFAMFHSVVFFIIFHFSCFSLWKYSNNVFFFSATQFSQFLFISVHFEWWKVITEWIPLTELITKQYGNVLWLSGYN